MRAKSNKWSLKDPIIVFVACRDLIQNVILLFLWSVIKAIFYTINGRKQSNIVLGRKMDEFFREKLC